MKNTKSNNDKSIYVVHCIDTEGPLYESLEATFGRLYDLFGISLKPTRENLEKIQGKKMDFGKLTGMIAEVFNRHLLNYNDSWDKIDRMLKKIMSKQFRNELKDSFGGGWVYNWFCTDHVGYESNPRRKEIGYHKVYDFYKKVLDKYNSHQDGMYWHFHPMTTYKEAHRNATCYATSPHLYEGLCRRIIERSVFSPAVRAGFQAERPDSNLFFEQWIPFDFTNWAYHAKQATDIQLDLKGGRSGDWRLAPDDWSCYQPSHDNWQIPGNCRRWIARSIDIITRDRNISQEEVDKAFQRANSGKPTLMAFNDHDFRDMAYEVNFVREKIAKAAVKYPDVKFKFCNAVEAFRSLIYGPGSKHEPIKLNVELLDEGERLFLKVETVSGEVFGPQPFLAIKMKSGRFVYDNLDFDTSLKKWSYTFDYDSIYKKDVEAVGIGANDKYGNSFVKVITR